jgi:predicted dehydrogenase
MEATMTEEKKVRLAVIGIGVMGTHHVRDVATLPQTELAAVCDIDKERADRHAQEYQVPAFYDHQSLFEKMPLDGVIIATPHYDHTPISIAAMQKGIHVLVEKPIAVHVKDAQKMITAYEQARQTFPNLVFAAMFMMRTYGYWRKIKDMIDGGQLGRLVRTTWIITNWFRTQTYYDNGGWRATWKGEGGGVLLNQCPHNLDLYQWFTGLPKKVAGYASIGKYHHIEVEDEVTGYFEHENGMVGHFITTTAESPGSNRLEIDGENGKLIFENGVLSFYRNQESMLENIKTSLSGFQQVENELVDVPYEYHGESGHRIITENFAEAILHGTPLIAPAVEGIRPLELGNAIMLSSFLGRPVELPIDAEEYASRLQALIKTSRFQKEVRDQDISDFSKSFNQ